MLHGGIVVVFEHIFDGLLEKVKVFQLLICEWPTNVVEEVGTFNVDNLCNVAFCQLSVAKPHCQYKVEFEL